MNVYTVTVPGQSPGGINYRHKFAGDKASAKRHARWQVMMGHLPAVTLSTGRHATPRPVWGIRLAVRHFMSGHNA